MSVQSNEFITIPVGENYSPTDHGLRFYPEGVIDDLQVGDVLAVDFDGVILRMERMVRDSHAVLRVISGGTIGQNKGVSVDRFIPLPSLTEKDISAIDLGRKLGIKYFALSFANLSQDVDKMRDLAGRDSFIISKIETLCGVNNLTSIGHLSDAILIDRGDLSREIPIANIPYAQEFILTECKKIGTPVFVATNLLESTIAGGGGTRAEVHDVAATIKEGASGLVLAAETAVGKDPLRSVSTLVKLVGAADRFGCLSSEVRVDTFQEDFSLLRPPHGGELIEQMLSRDWLTSEGVGCPRLTVPTEVILDCEQLSTGTYSPLKGFMGLEQLQSVLFNSSLPDGTTWTLPIVCPIPKAMASSLSMNDKIILTNEEGKEKALLSISEVFEYDLVELCSLLFGTVDNNHPGVRTVKAWSGRFIAGPVHCFAEVGDIGSSDGRYYTPTQLRNIFEHRGWSRIVAFHTRNPPHRAHEFIQLKALDETYSDGLLISPVLGPTKPGDFVKDCVLNSYDSLIRKKIFPPEKTLIGGFKSYSRFAGPREAIFTALCRLNMGCSHFIIGRDHAGVSGFYTRDDFDKYFDSLGDIGIDLIQFDKIVWDQSSKCHTAHSDAIEACEISGTEARQLLEEGNSLPAWFMRQEVQETIKQHLNSSDGAFYQ